MQFSGSFSGTSTSPPLRAAGYGLDAPDGGITLTGLATLSGVTLAGIGSAFWGVVAGAMALFVQQYRQRPA